MDELLEICEQADAGINELRSFCEDMKVQLRAILYGPAAEAATAPKTAAAKDSDLPCPSPQQMKKRAKRLTSLAEGDDTGEVRSSLRISNSKLFGEPEPAADAEPVAEARKSLETPSAKTRGKASKQSSAAATEAAKTAHNEESEQSLMPPPTVPPPATQLNTTTTAAAEQSFGGRPQRAAKLKSEKNLKEPRLNSKMRQPSLTDQVRVKLEHEQRASQAHSGAKASSDDSLFIVPQKAPSVVSVSDADDLDSGNKENDANQVNEDVSEKSRPLRVKIKKEKLSLGSEGPPVAVAPPPTSTAVNESSVLTNSSTMSTTTQSKRTRKKKDVPLPMMLPAQIKQERLSGSAEDGLEQVAQPEEEKEAPVASRTRQGSVESQSAVAAAAAAGDKAKARSPSIYEDAIDKDSSVGNREKAATPVPGAMAAAVNETVTLSGGMPPGGGDATFCTNPAQTTFQVGPGQTTFVMGNPNATVSLGNKSGGGEQVDATFNVAAPESRDEAEQQQSFATAKQSMETARNDDSLLTDDDSDGTVTPPVVSASKLLANVVTKLPIPGSAKFYKMPTRTNELFNPLVQSPVKKKVEAFENAAAEQKKSSRSKTSKDGTAMSSMKTPQVGKLQGPALGRFLTPTQASNVTPNMMAAALGTKKAPNSASKAMPFPKMNSASNLKSTTTSAASSSAKTLTRSNSADEMRKGIAQLNEERKRLREQKQVLAAQQREAKEKERAERLAKLNKEREEKRLKKLQEAELKKRELEEIQRKLREEANKAAAAKSKAMDQESEMLKQIKPTSAKMKMPPPPPARLEYNFEMLHEDDSTDDEAKTSYKRPPPPLWSRSHVRGPAILMQQHWPTNFIDSFFSVQPTTPDLREIFPNIKESYLKRNSSVFWSTPPRYSELPKY